MTIRTTARCSLAALAIVLAGIGGCSGTDTKDGSTSAPPASSAGADTSDPSGQNSTDEMKAAQRALLQHGNQVDASYDEFYIPYDQGSQDFNRLHDAAPKIAAAQRAFARFVQSYDWPSSVPQSVVDSVIADYTTKPGGADDWDAIAAAKSVEEMRRIEESSHSYIDTANSHTDALREAIGLPPAGGSAA